MNYAPIALFCYARKDHLEKVIDSLLKNQEASNTDLIVFSDGSKNNTRLKVQEVREYVRTISGFKSLRVVEREKNYGLAKNIISGVTEIVSQYGRIIVLEDDIVISPFFLEYMNFSLDRYENNEEVISIHGYVYPIKGLPDFFFVKGADCWGWATWKRGWDLFEKDGTKLLSELKKRKLCREFDFNYSYPYTSMLEGQIKGTNDSWAIRWYASAFLKNKYTLYPGKSYVENIGFDGTGTHCSVAESFSNKIDVCSNFIYTFPENVKDSFLEKEKFIVYFESIQSKKRKLLTFFKRLWR